MSKEQIRQMLAQQTERYQTVYGGEVTLYAPHDPNPKPLLSPSRKPGRKRLTNEREQEYKKYLEQVAAGTYQPEQEPQVDYQARNKRGRRGQEHVLLTGWV
ncbi:beta-ketoadipyl CoA thiolase [Ectopseudomonas mendocina]|uniref:Beta-ketoadipyl CoA thiolase n=1 Tax=Ectopseudomonas mendocina TaxID=300 RepID=A0A379PP42_ECTME|nr:hypothetical protein [Pseudomonas mendocina]SUE95763.1 beta-ketoadipyl CoA thiolase [Pseudomonas mendocina]